MRRLGLSTQSVEKGVEGREFNAPVEIGRSLTGCHGSELHDNQYIRCGKVSSVNLWRNSTRATPIDVSTFPFLPGFSNPILGLKA